MTVKEFYAERRARAQSIMGKRRGKRRLNESTEITLWFVFAALAMFVASAALEAMR